MVLITFPVQESGSEAFLHEAHQQRVVGEVGQKKIGVLAAITWSKINGN